MSKRTSPPKSRRLESLTRLIERALAASLTPAAGSPRVLSEAMRYCVASGGKGRWTSVLRPKRFRPLLCLGGCEAVGGDVRQALPAACAIELIHTYSLVHDDLPAMDDADERRGQPSCHRRFGEATAILVGDALLTRAFELLSMNGTSFDSPRRQARLAQDSPERSRGAPNTLAILRTLGQASGTAGLIGGQVLDLKLHAPRSRLQARQVEEIARRKTAALITASVVSGGLAASAGPEALRCLQRYGRKLGLAFQLMDDLRDRDGLAQVRRPEQVRRHAMRLIAQAVHALKPFGRRADVLHKLAGWLATT